MDIERAREHLANERTFLAWVRTAVAMIVFGFAIGRFGLALRELALLQGATLPTNGLSIWFGTASMLFGVVVMIAAVFRYRRTRRELEQDMFQNSGGLIVFVAVATTMFGIALVAYLLMTQKSFG